MHENISKPPELSANSVLSHFREFSKRAVLVLASNFQTRERAVSSSSSSSLDGTVGISSSSFETANQLHPVCVCMCVYLSVCLIHPWRHPFQTLAQILLIPLGTFLCTLLCAPLHTSMGNLWVTLFTPWEHPCLYP